MRKIASNLLLKEHAERVFFLCKQPDGYRIIKEIDGDYGQQILTHYQNGYGILLSEHGNIPLNMLWNIGLEKHVLKY